MAAAPADLPGLVRQRYRLRPDRRLLLAVAEIQRLRTGVAPAPVEAELQDGRWRILSGSDEVGVLSEFPTFEEATGLLASWAGRWPQAPAGGRPPGLRRCLHGGTGRSRGRRRGSSQGLLLARRIARGRPGGRREGPLDRVGSRLALHDDRGPSRPGRSPPRRVLGLAGARTRRGTRAAKRWPRGRSAMRPPRRGRARGSPRTTPSGSMPWATRPVSELSARAARRTVPAISFISRSWPNAIRPRASAPRSPARRSRARRAWSPWGWRRGCRTSRRPRIWAMAWRTRR